MLDSRFKSADQPASRKARRRAIFAVVAFLATGMTSFDAAAGMLEKLLAPAVGTKPGFSEGKKTYDEDTLKPDELMICVVKAHDIDDRTAHKPGGIDELAKQREQLHQTAVALKAEIDAASKDPISEDKAKDLNDRVAAYKAKEADFNARSGTANADAMAFTKAQNADIETFRDVCAGKRFYKSDLESIRPKLPFDISDILAGKK